MADPVKLVEPPVTVPPIMANTTGGQQFSQAWTEHNQNIADRINAIGVGITNGSDAQAGKVGETMTASGSSIALANGVASNVATVTLTAGDWEVFGQVSFNAGAGTHSYFAGGIGGPGDVIQQSTFPSTAITPAFTTATHRYNVTTATSISLVAQAGFTSGTCSASGNMTARRMR